jgi:uncharacterized membrane protein YccC
MVDAATSAIAGPPAHPLRGLARWAQAEAQRPDFRRAVRSTTAIMVLAVLALLHRLPVELPLAMIAAHGLALLDVRGAYPVRFAFLVVMMLVQVGCVELGTLCAPHAGTAVLGTAIIAANAGLWRHLTPEYGPALATSSALMFFMALALPPGARHASHAASVAVGASWALLLQVMLWPIRAQHPLRRAVADSWVAAADYFDAVQRRHEPADEDDASEDLAFADAADIVIGRPPETDLRAALERTYTALLGTTAARRARPIVRELEHLHLLAARLATRVSALATALEEVRPEPVRRKIEPPFRGALEALSQACRAAAVAIVSRQPAHLTVAEVRLRRSASLLAALRDRIAGHAADAGAEVASHLVEIVGHIERVLPEIGDALRATTDRAGERALFPLELLDLNTWKLRPLTAVLNLSAKPDPAIVRFTLRAAVVLMIAVWLMTRFPLAHGYWLPMTATIVLQADYGATRAKAAQRLSGTLLGSLLGSGLLMLHLPLPVLLTATAATAFGFGFFLRRNYGIASIFITLFVVLLTESAHPVTIALTVERLGSTVAGGTLALVAALLFWPTWERSRFPRALAKAIRANRGYAAALVAHPSTQGRPQPEAVAAKRAVESANQAAFASLERMFADPRSRRENTEQAAVVLNANQRLTRVLNVLALHLTTTSPDVDRRAMGWLADRGGAALAALADAVERGGDNIPAHLEPAAHAFTPADAARGSWTLTQLSRAVTEINGMLGAWREADLVPAVDISGAGKL